VDVAGDCVGKEKEESQSGGHSGPDCEASPVRRRPVKGNERRSDSDGRPFASDRGRIGYLLLIPFGDQKFSKSKNPCNNHFNCFYSLEWFDTIYYASEKSSIKCPSAFLSQKMAKWLF
jgi:hypothetical protein